MRQISAEFATSDDLLREASRNRLTTYGPIRVVGSGQIGPLVEMELGFRRYGQQYEAVVIDTQFSRLLREAISSHRHFGGEHGANMGVFPLTEENPVTIRSTDWEQWLLHAENSAKSHGLNSGLASSLIGTLLEMQDNIYEHSGTPLTGFVAYASGKNYFEFVVSDGGIGPLATLRQNPRFSKLPDTGAALNEMIKDGVSRFPRESNRGTGFNQLFRSLVSQNTDVRFRSDDYALTVAPQEGVGRSILSHVAQLNGLTINVRHRKEF